MSTFEGIVPEIQGISIDKFDGENRESCVYFLSHCHTDHMKGLCDSSFTDEQCIYLSEVSAVILKNSMPHTRKHLRPLSVNETHTIKIPPSKYGGEEVYISVSLIPAGHCPGSVMFLFKLCDKRTILYTGDFRLAPQDLPKIRKLNTSNGKPKHIDKLYFDSTFWGEEYDYFPSRELSRRAICDAIREWISQSHRHIVYIQISANYGSEFLYKEIANEFQMKIFVRERCYKTYSEISDMDGAFTLNPSTTQIHSDIKFWAPKIADAKIRHIKPSALRWKNLTEDMSIVAVEEDYNKFFVCYSSHSSSSELKGFLEYLKPKAVEPCVVPKERIQRRQFYDSLQAFCGRFLETPCAPPLSMDLDATENVNNQDSVKDSLTLLTDTLDDSCDEDNQGKETNTGNVYKLSKFIDDSEDVKKPVILSKRLKLF